VPHGGLDVVEAVLRCRAALEVAPALDVGRRVADLDARFDAVEQGRRDGEEAVGRVSVGDAADVAVDPKYLLDHHEAALRRPRRPRHVGRQLEPVGCLKPDRLTHAALLRCRTLRPRDYNGPCTAP
jgi:hypothetical protein